LQPTQISRLTITIAPSASEPIPKGHLPKL
jgi:hypothetical protein